MIITEIYNGQGLGNQLACYVTTRVLAADKNYEFGIMSPHKLKCKDFIDIDPGKPVIGGAGPEGGPPVVLPVGITNYYKEKFTLLPDRLRTNIMIDDPGLELIPDNTKIDGYFQSENRIYHRKEEIKRWLKVHQDKDDYSYTSDDTCIINFRGGEWVSVPEFFLNKKYWENAVTHMLKIRPTFKFAVVTDDPSTAYNFFPKHFTIIHSGICKDYCIVKNARYLIVSNSSFAYFPTLTSETVQYIIAPKYWGRHNISDGYWSLGYNIYRNHNYIDRDGNIFNYDECVKEFDEYRKKCKYYA